MTKFWILWKIRGRSQWSFTEGCELHQTFTYMCQINQLLAEIRNLKNLPISPRNWLKSSLISLKKSPVFNCIMGLTPSEKPKGALLSGWMELDRDSQYGPEQACIIHDWKYCEKMPWLRTGFWLGADYRRILTSDVKQTIRDGELEEKQSFLCLKQSFFRDVSHKTTKKSSRKIVRDHSRQCPVQYWRRIGPAIEQSVGLILVTGPLSRVINIYIHVIFFKLIAFMFRPVYGQSR